MNRSELYALVAVANAIEASVLDECCPGGHMCRTCRMWWGQVVQLDTRIGGLMQDRHDDLKTGAKP